MVKYGIALFFLAALVGIAGYVTNVAWLISKVTTSTDDFTVQIVVSLLGVLAVPLGALHGIVLWFI